MSSNEALYCPICRSSEFETILDLGCGKMDGSTLYRNVIINACINCGHVFNKLDSEQYAGLIQYYDEEYAPTNLRANDSVGDRPGSKNSFTLNRYAQLYAFLKSYVNPEDHVLDVGCAMGGCLDYLSEQGFYNLYGIEPTQNYLDYANKSGRHCIKQGSAESIPFNDSIFNVLIIDQVLEHLLQPLNAFKEAKRVLKNNGLFCVGVPDALRYNDFYIFDFYWFILREHIQHYDMDHLNILAASQGFEMVSYLKSENPMMSAQMILPNLNVLYQLTGNTSKPFDGQGSLDLRDNLKKYISRNILKLNEKRDIILQMKLSQKELYLWGIGREFLYLYEQTDLRYCNISALIDSNPYKQESVTVNDIKITDPSVIKRASSKSAVIITATAHAASIKKSLSELGYKGDIVEL